ncbi:helix-turn-helix domain-containing protein [Intestinibacter bartlettii]|uniref:helix-turn-helix domain-containing protein n=1 Tax=Intestinibacter bartlettii TaxID=261299 RepID=UPI0039961F8C
MQGENYTKFKNQIWKDKSIKGYEKLVLIYLISYNNETLGYSFPTKKQIQIDTGVSENTLNKVLNNLIEKGYH